MIYPGIDLGTTYSMIAHVNAYGQPALFPDLLDASQFRTPSVVHMGKQGCLIGAAVEELLEENADIEVARFIKALLARPDYQLIDPQGRNWNALGLSALILKKLMRDATAFSGEDIGPTVLTVPAQFNDEQRRATLSAAQLAGLGDLRLVEEPVAAAAFYGQEEGATDRTLMVYDFGGGTFDVTLLQTSPDGLFVLATDGEAALGGRNLDEAIMALVDRDFRNRFGLSPLSDPPTVHRLRRVAEDAKIKLSHGGLSQIRKPLMLLGQHYEFALTRSQMEEIAAQAVDRSLIACDRCLAAAGLQWSNIDKIMLTGGSSLLPRVSQDLSQRWGRSVHELVLKQPHQAVVFGAAILAARFAAQDTPTNFRQVASADLALRVWDSQSGSAGLEVLIPRNAPLPAKHTRTVFTSRPDQTTISFAFVQRRQRDEESSMGKFVFGPIAAPRQDYPIELTVALAQDGLAHVTARDLLSGQAMKLALREGAGGTMAELDTQRRLVASVDLH